MATAHPAPQNVPIPEGFEVDDDLTARFSKAEHFFYAHRTEALLATKEGNTFAYGDSEGNMRGDELGMGLYHEDTRFLSRLQFAICGHSPVLLSSSAERAYMAYVDLTNPMMDHAGVVIQAQTLNIRRTRVIRGRLFERIRVKNYNMEPVPLAITLTVEADFADIFHVRGLHEPRFGRFCKPIVDGSLIVFAHLGEDGAFRQTRIDLGQTPDDVSVIDGVVTATFDLALEPDQTHLFSMTVEPIVNNVRPIEQTFDVAVHDLRRSYDAWEHDCTLIDTDNEVFNQLLQRGRRDLRALLTETPEGRYIAAGIPWYVTAFGRDSLITAHQMLMLNPGPARDTLRLLARYQGDAVDAWRDMEPGKILHEIRGGELARAGVVPHTPYYGTVDATPLFMMLYGTYFKWTNDVDFARELAPNIDRALEWIERYGDQDGDGFVEYEMKSSRGLVNQGWKDSGDAIVHADGTLAQGPIALAEVQGYVYLGKLRVADVFDAIGRSEDAQRLREEARALKEKFNEAFWVAEDEYYAMALDGEKRPVRSVSSNPAHGLYCDLLDEDKAAHVARRLLKPDMFTGWGIRTLSKSASAYNPMSYHNGSVWPHDNAMIAAGLKRYHFDKQTNRVATALFDAGVYIEYMRLPELFCGFTRRSPSEPVRYPVACSPQAWAAGAPFLLLQSILGLSARAPDNLVTINSPNLPPWLNWVELRNLRVGDSIISLVFRREGETTGFSLLSKQGSIRVVMEE